MLQSNPVIRFSLILALCVTLLSSVSTSATTPAQDASAGQRVPGLQVLATDQTSLSLSNHFGQPNSSTVAPNGDFVFMGAGLTGLFVRRAGTDAIARIWQMGDPVPGLPGSRTDIIAAYRANAVGAVAFLVEVGPATNETTRALLFFDGTSVRTLATGLDVAPNTGGARYGRTMLQVELTDAGDVYFTTSVVRDGQAAQPTLFRIPAVGAAERLVGAGDTAPDTGGGTFSSLSMVGVTPSGAVLFLSSISGGTGGNGYFLLTSEGLRKVTSTGDTVDGIAITSVSGGTLNASGQVAHLANNGTSLWRYTVAGGHTRVISPGTTVPAPASGTFSTLSGVQLDDTGHLAFLSNITGASTASSGVFRSRPGVSVVDVVAVRTQAAPASGGTYNAFSGLVMHGGGTLSFRATLTGGSAALGLFQSVVGASVAALVLDGAAWSGGGTLAVQTSEIQALSSGALRFSALVEGTSNFAEVLWSPGTPPTMAALLQSTDLLPAGSRVVFRNRFIRSQGDLIPFRARRAGGRLSIAAYSLTSGTTTILLTEGDALPGTGGGVVSSLSSNAEVVASGANGTVAILATVAGGTQNGAGLFAFVPGQGLQKVAVVGDQDSTNVTLTSISFAPLGRDSQISPSGQILFSAGGAVMLGTPGATPVRIAGTGTLTEGGGSIVGTMTPLAVNANGQVLFRANSRAGMESASGVARYFIGTTGGTPVSILTLGATAPGGGALTAVTTSPAFNAAGYMAFKAVLDGGSASGIFLVSSTGEITTVARHGGEAFSGHQFSMTGSHPDVVLNDAGDVVFRSDLTGGASDSGYFVRRALTGPVQTLVLQGQAAPGTSGTFATFGPSLNGFLNENFQLAATGDVSVRATIVGDAQSSGGYWHLAPNLAPIPMAIQGQSRPGLNGALVVVTGHTPSWMSGGRSALWLRVSGGASSEEFVLYVPAPVVSGPAAQNVAVGAPATFAVSATSPRALTYQWQMSVDGGTTFTAVPGGAPFSGGTTATLTVSPTSAAMDQTRFRCVVTDGPSTTTSAAAVLAVEGVIRVSPGALNFAAVKNGADGAITSQTAAQTVAVTFSSGAPAWTVATDQPWVQLSASGGTGAGVLTIGIANPGNVIGGATSLTATVTVTGPGVDNRQVLPIQLAITQSTQSASTPPVGQFETPVQNATGLQGAIGVTGWVLDDVGVAHVKIYRQCLDFEDQNSCQFVLGHRVVYIGDAAFLDGARPDVAQAFPNLPATTRAGWGFLLLTSMLPHIPNQQGFGGQGPLTLYAVATDVEGNEKLLGRSSDPASAEFATPTQITMDNNGIAKPFGSIDTPGQGETVSGVLHNFGWALTPDSNTIAGEGGDILIPTDGSTVTVFIDGLPVAQVTYNQCRGNVGNPPGAGVFCNDDVSNVFGNPTPQPTFTVRTSNPTLFRNLDATRGAIGSFTIDTRTLTNGSHTIAWSVTDSAGRTEGIGSRVFTVLNSGADAFCSAECAVRSAAEGVRSALARADVGPAVEMGTRSAAVARTAQQPDGDAVWVRTGFDLSTAWGDLLVGDDRVRRVELPQLGRLELWLGAAIADAWIEHDGVRQALPIGASVRGAQFVWAPPAGYLGEYTLVFLRGGDRVEVVVGVR